MEEFISRLIRHIPDEQFKTIRHYGMYSRRTKNLCKRVLSAWQQKTKRWIVKVKKALRRQTWREKEEIPLSVVRDFDLMDDGDPTTPPMLSCEKCGGQMYPEYYEGVHGIKYRLSDILETKG